MKRPEVGKEGERKPGVERQNGKQKKREERAKPIRTLPFWLRETAFVNGIARLNWKKGKPKIGGRYAQLKGKGEGRGVSFSSD